MDHVHVPTDINYELVISSREKNTPYHPLFASPPSPLSYDFIVMPIKMKDDRELCFTSASTSQQAGQSLGLDGCRL